MKKIISITLFLILLLSLSACSNSGDASGPSGMSPEGGEFGFSTSDGEFQELQAGQLTGAELRDIDNYSTWLTLFDENQEDEVVFANYHRKWEIITQNLISVTILCNELPVSNALVKIYNKDGELLFTSFSNVYGEATIFPPVKLIEGKIIASSGENEKELIFNESTDMSNLVINLDSSNPKLQTLEIMFVIDTTGSMGDEMRYLKAEISDVISKIVEKTNYNVSLALLFYRDIGDDYVTRYYDFSSDIDAQQANLKSQSAGGGGDYPEAVDQALSEAVAKQWSSGNTTKLLFHVLDAPPHEASNNVALYKESVLLAASKGIRIIPVASSGVDRKTEYLLRSSALLTNGTYVFLTNHSGIGNDHLEPVVEDYDVELLNQMLVRIAVEFTTGEKIPKVILEFQENQDGNIIE